MDWILSLTTFLSMACLARRMWQGWLIGLANQALWLYLIFTRPGMYGLLPLAVALTCVYTAAIWNWRQHHPSPAPEPVREPEAVSEPSGGTMRVVDDQPTNVIVIEREDGRGTRSFRQVPAAVVRTDPDTREPVILKIIATNATAFGDRVELINILVPEECFTTL